MEIDTSPKIDQNNVLNFLRNVFIFDKYRIDNNESLERYKYHIYKQDLLHWHTKYLRISTLQKYALLTITLTAKIFKK